MFKPIIQTANTLGIIAHLQRQVSAHLREIACCHRELHRCITDPYFGAPEREALKIQIEALTAEVEQWRLEIQRYKEQYKQLSGANAIVRRQQSLPDEKSMRINGCCDEDSLSIGRLPSPH